jgi:hypothetical protein
MARGTTHRMASAEERAPGGEEGLGVGLLHRDRRGHGHDVGLVGGHCPRPSPAGQGPDAPRAARRKMPRKADSL